MSETGDVSSTILSSAARLLRETPFDEISYRILAEAAGVSERTVFRRYPTRAHLLEALSRWIEEHALPLPAFTSFEQFREAVHTRFRAFDAAPAYAFVCARAASVSPTLTAEASFLTEAVRALVDECAPRLNNRDTLRIASTLGSFASAQFWARMRSGYGAGAAEACAAFDAVLDRVVATLPAQSRAAAR